MDAPRYVRVLPRAASPFRAETHQARSRCSGLRERRRASATSPGPGGHGGRTRTQGPRVSGRGSGRPRATRQPGGRPEGLSEGGSRGQSAEAEGRVQGSLPSATKHVVWGPRPGPAHHTPPGVIATLDAPAAAPLAPGDKRSPGTLPGQAATRTAAGAPKSEPRPAPPCAPEAGRARPSWERGRGGAPRAHARPAPEQRR